MLFKRFLFLVLASFISVSEADGQADDFCKAITAIVRDAPNGFRNIKGKPAADGRTWACGIKVPGTIASRFVTSMGVYYEGGFFQTKNKEEVKWAYEKYKHILINCLAAHGYVMTQVDNFYPGMGDYKKLIFMNEGQAATADNKPPAHITMEVLHSKELGNYAIVMYIFEH